MARETKVGLLIGLGMILLIGIIISDQLAMTDNPGMRRNATAEPPARASPNGDRSRADGARSRGSGGRGENIPLPGEMPGRSSASGGEPSSQAMAFQLDDSTPRSRGSGSATRFQRTAPNAGGSAPPRESTPPTIEGPGSRDERATRQRPEPADRNTGGQAPSDNRPQVAAINDASPPREPTPTSANQPSNESDSPAAPDETRSGTQANQPRGVQPEQGSRAGERAESATDPQGASDAGQLFHTVKRRETLYDLAKKYYGDGSQWKRIQKANLDEVSASGAVKAGVELVIPDQDRADGEGSDDTSPQDEPSRMEQVRQATETRRITVRRGDRLMSLARDYLGDGGRWRAFIEANPDKLDGPRDLRAGMTLQLPSIASPSDSGDATQRTRPNRDDRDDDASADPTPRTYTVQPNDTLYDIAEKQLDSGGRWQAIYEANRDKLDSPDDITVGMTLTLPE